MSIPAPSAIAAAQRLPAGFFAPTPLVPGPGGLHLKLETALLTGSFKPRGALCALASRLEAGPVAEVIASSTGNHGARSPGRPKRWAGRAHFSACRR